MACLELYGSNSLCCFKPSRIVVSRAGGFVSQNCTGCGKSRKLPSKELPDLVCKECGAALEKYINSSKNYAIAAIGPFS